ncbi:TPA: helix-turn-helix domain-containing protein [Streptococcus suis]
MQIDRLFEKRERAIYQLLLYLENRKDQPFLKEVCAHLELSKSTLVRYIETFNEQANDEGLGLEFQMSKEQIFLKREGNLSRQEIIAFLCGSSVKYQILCALFDKDHLSVQMLAQDTLLSEATLNRQLASLNQLLSEFKISIKGGRLKGSELQIRYFYHQLFHLTNELSNWQSSHLLTDLERLLPVFERFYQSNLNKRQADSVLLWLVIAQKRFKLNQLDFKPLYQLMEPYLEHKFYKALRKMYFTLVQQQAVTFQEGESMSLFAFLFSHFILAPHQLEQVLGFGGPVMEATSRVVQEIRQFIGGQYAVSEEGLYHINQIMSQLYFFQTSIQLEEAENGIYREESERIIQQVSQTIYRKRNWKNESSSHLVFMLESLFTYLSQVEPIQVKVGFASSQHEVFSYPKLMQLRERLEGNRQVQIDYFNAETVVDLLITDYFQTTDLPVYYITDRIKERDIHALKGMIQELYQLKLLESKKLIQENKFPIEHR